jgi:DNA repair protein RadC
VNYNAEEIIRRRGGCGCLEPKGARKVAESVVRDHGAALAKAGAEPIVLAAGEGSKCRPFLKVEKDPVKFAACNRLADKIGPITAPEKAFRLIKDAIGDEVNEVFGIVTLDLHLRMKSIAETGRGEPDSVQAPMVPTLQAALIDGAHAVVLFHVHPSGVKAQPSDADKKTTKAFLKAFDTVNVHLLDHVIVGGDKKTYFSFAEDGLL